MATRQEQIRRSQMAQEARARLTSGQRQSVEPLVNPRTAALRSYTSQQAENPGITGKTMAELKQSLPSSISSFDPVSNSTLGKAVGGDFSAKQSIEQASGVKFRTPALSNNPLANSSLIRAVNGDKQARSLIEDYTGATFDQYELNRRGIEANTPDNPFLKGLYNATVKPYANVMNEITNNNPVGKFVTRFGQSAADMMGGSATLPTTTGSPFADKAADIGGALAGFAAPIGMPGGNLMTAPFKAADQALMTKGGMAVENMLSKPLGKVVNPQLAQSVAKNTLREGTAGAVQGAGISAIQGGDDRDMMTQAALGGGLGFGLGGIGSVLGEVGKSILSKIKKVNNEDAALRPASNDPSASQPFLALPEAKASSFLALPEARVNKPILALPEARINEPTKARIGKGKSLDTILQDIKTGVDTRMTPPYENPNELAKWVQGHLGPDYSLNEVRKLTYEDLGQLSEEIRKKLNVYDVAKSVATDHGYDLDKLLAPKKPISSTIAMARETQRMREVAGVRSLVKTKKDLYNDGALSEAAAPRQIFISNHQENMRNRIGKSSMQQTAVSNEGLPNAVALKMHDEPLVTQKMKGLRSEELMSDPINVVNPRTERILSSQLKSEPLKVEEPGNPHLHKEAADYTQHMENKQKEAGYFDNGATPQERGFAKTLRNSEKTPASFKNDLTFEYTPITNEETVAAANQRLDNNVDEATSFVLSNTKFDAEKSATAQRLIDHYNAQGNYRMAVTIADKVATEATKAGQFIQSLSIFNRLTPEGVLIHAKKIANRANENLPKTAKPAEVTEKMAQDLTQLAGVTQKMTGVKNLSNEVMDILQRAKSGEKLSSAETDALRRFVNESKQFIKDSTKQPKPPMAPRTPKDSRVREALATFLDAQEQAAKDRLKARGIRMSSTPLDVWADYAVIGAAKMGKGVIKFADWSDEMIKELGEDIRPILNNLYERSRDTFDLSTKKITNERISQAERLAEKVIKTKDLSEQEANSLMDLARKVSNLSGEEKRVASQDLQSILQQLDRPGMLRKISTAQTMAQLLNPKTHVRNVLGNELFYRIERLNKLVASPIDFARSRLTGTDRYVSFRNHNQGQFWKNFMEGAKAGWKGVNINGLETQFDLSGAAFKSKYNPLTYMEKALGASLRGFDNAAYMRAYNDTLGELGTLDALNNGVKPTKEYVQYFISRADDNITSIADQYGKYVTFQDNNAISRNLSSLKKGMNFHKDFGLGDLILKYPKTPGALLMRALEYSPAGFLRSASIIAKPLLKNGVEKNPTEATLALSRAVVGTFGLSGLGYYLMDKGVITGQASKDRDIRALETAAGQGQYQVNLSALQRFVLSGFDPGSASLKEGDSMYTYDWMQPVSVAVSMGANIKKNIDAGKDKASGLASTGLNSLAGGINTLTEQSVLQGLAKLANGTPGQSITDKLIDIVTDFPSSFVPTAFNQIKQLTDNTKRETYSPSKLDQSLNMVKAKIPGVAERLPAQYDTLGNEKKHYQNNNPFNVLLNPGFSSKYELSPEAKLIVGLIAETGDETLAPRVPLKSVDGNKLTGEQFSRYSQLQGEQTRERLSKINPGSSIKSQTKNVERALDVAGKQAKKQLVKEFGLIKTK